MLARFCEIAVKLMDLFRLTELIDLDEGGLVYADKAAKEYLLNKQLLAEIKLFEDYDLSRDCLSQPPKKQLVSVVLVTYNSEYWLPGLITDLKNVQEYLKEIMIVDNGSSDASLSIIEADLPNAIVIRNDVRSSFSTGVNLGMQQATGEFVYIINPDIRFSRKSFECLLRKAMDVCEKGIVSPKIRLLTNPHFLNGVGNKVGHFFWGYDNGLGYPDFGQFDSVEKLESACFAAILIPRLIFEQVGLLDDGYVMYYEDVDWSLRLRMAGYSIFFEPNGVVYHAFSGHQEKTEGISAKKLEFVTYGRLRLIKKFLSGYNYLSFFLSYLLYDLIYCMYSIFRRRTENISAIFHGWQRYFFEPKSNLNINPHNYDLLPTEKKKAANPIEVKNEIFFPRMKNGKPLLTKNMFREGKYQWK